MYQKIISTLFLLLLTQNISVAQTTENPKTVHPSMGMGLNGISDWSTQLPFIDLMKQSREWMDWSNRASTLPIHTNKSDWITKLEPGQTLGTVFLTPKTAPIYPAYVVRYEGDGEIKYKWAAKKDLKQSRKGRDFITVKKGAALLEIIKTNPENPIRNISIVAVDHLSSWEKGDIFNPDWIEKMKPFRALRYMDWQKTNNSEPLSWEERPKMNDRSWDSKGVPLEAISALSNKLNSIPWINIPHWADQEFIKNMASILHQNLNTNLPLYVEHSNEVWNFGFKQAKHAYKASEELWGKNGDAFVQWHGMRTAVMCDAFKKGAFAKSKNRVICTLGVHTAVKGREKAALNCPLWKEAPCVDHGIDAIAITTYFDARLNGPRKTGPKQDLDNIKKLIKHPDRINLAFKQIEDGSIIPTPIKKKPYLGLQIETANSVGYWSGIAKKHKLSLIAYEGGQHITANGQALQNDEDTIEFHKAINRDPKMKASYKTMLAEWKKSGGGLHMHFVDIRAPGKWGSWGALESVKQSSSPKWDALMEFNAAEPCWWEHCKEFPIERREQQP